MEDKNKYFEADGQHEAIIDNELFQLAQEKLNRYQQTFRTKLPKEDKYFCGVLYCGKCGNRFTTHQNHHIRKDGSEYTTGAYKCSGAIYDNCKIANIVHYKIENLFNEYVENIDTLSATNAEIKSIETADKKKQILDYIAECENKLKAQEKRKKQAMEQYMDGNIDFTEYRQLLDLSNEKYEVLINEIEKAKSEIPEDNQNKITREDIITELSENWQRLNNKERFIFLQRFVKKIVIVAEKISERKSIISIQSVEFNAK